MKKLFTLFLLLNFSIVTSYADDIIQGDSIKDVRIYAKPKFRDIRVFVKNQSDVDIICKGIVRAWTRRGRNIKFNYNNNILAGKSSIKVFTMRKADLFGAFASHSIKCYEL